MPDQLTLAYLAGVIDSDGYISSGWKNTTESARRRADAVIAEAEALLDG